jgi:hypothetical protein
MLLLSQHFECCVYGQLHDALVEAVLAKARTVFYSDEKAVCCIDALLVWSTLMLEHDVVRCTSTICESLADCGTALLISMQALTMYSAIWYALILSATAALGVRATRSFWL